MSKKMIPTALGLIAASLPVSHAAESEFYFTPKLAYGRSSQLTDNQQTALTQHYKIEKLYSDLSNFSLGLNIGYKINHSFSVGLDILELTTHPDSSGTGNRKTRVRREAISHEGKDNQHVKEQKNQSSVSSPSSISGASNLMPEDLDSTTSNGSGSSIVLLDDLESSIASNGSGSGIVAVEEYVDPNGLIMPSSPNGNPKNDIETSHSGNGLTSSGKPDASDKNNKKEDIGTSSNDSDLASGREDSDHSSDTNDKKDPEQEKVSSDTGAFTLSRTVFWLSGKAILYHVNPELHTWIQGGIALVSFHLHPTDPTTSNSDSAQETLTSFVPVLGLGISYQFTPNVVFEFSGNYIFGIKNPPLEHSGIWFVSTGVRLSFD